MRMRWIITALAALGVAVLGVWAGLYALESPLALTRGPYVMNPTSESITITWNASRPVDGWVEYGVGPAYGTVVPAPEQSAHHAVTLTGLASDTLYHYRVAGNGRMLVEGFTFRTSRGEENPHFTFVVLGDSGRGGPFQYAVADRIKAIRPDFVLHTGDVVYPAGEARHFDERFFRPYRDVITTIPFFLSLGNHDVATANGQAYLDAFPLPRNNPERTKRYYSFDYGNARFIALDSNQAPGPGGAMYAWLAAELVRPAKRWTFVFFHHPPYSSGPHGGSPALREAWSPLFERSRVAIVFTGHDHTYERTVPVRDYDTAGPGVVYVVTGGGGSELYKVGRSVWTAHAASRHHLVRVEVQGCVLDLQAITPDGTVFDRTRLDRCGHPS